jgi:hypothetical protein
MISKSRRHSPELYGPIWRIKLKTWLVYLARSCPRYGNYFGVVIGEPKRESKVQPRRGSCAKCGYEINWTLFQMAIDKIPPGPKLDALTAEKVFGWKNVHQHDDRDGFYGKRQDKAGRWRSAKIPTYSTETVHAYSIEERMEQLGRLDQYLRQLFRITHANNIPSDFRLSPDQRCGAAIKAMGQYGQVIQFRTKCKNS